MIITTIITVMVTMVIMMPISIMMIMTTIIMMMLAMMRGCRTAVLAQGPPTAEVTHLGDTLGSERRFARIFYEGAPRSGTRVECY